MPQIRYVGHRELHKDSTYLTGEWMRNQVKSIQNEVLASKLLRHPDVYQPAEVWGVDVETVSEESVAAKKKADEEASLQSIFDALSVMDVDALARFAESHYGIKVDRRRSLANLRSDVQGLVSRFGPPPR